MQPIVFASNKEFIELGIDYTLLSISTVCGVNCTHISCFMKLPYNINFSEKKIGKLVVGKLMVVCQNIFVQFWPTK